MDHDTLVRAQFGARAAAYVTSSVHAQGDDLRDVAAFVTGHAEARVLDLGCGGGHVSYVVAPNVREVIAYDLSEPMLVAVEAEATVRGCVNVSTACGAAEELRFDNDYFDFVITRFSAHHWSDVPLALAEAKRVFKPTGRAVFIDSIAPETVALDTFLQSIELLRDVSHVRSHTADQWLRFLGAAGFTATRTVRRRLRISFESWIARMQTPPVRSRAVRALQQSASAQATSYFEIEDDGSFVFDTIAIEADRG